MEENSKVFQSEITRSAKCLRNDLYTLVNVTPAVPIPRKQRDDKGDEVVCDFIPRVDKYYIPKKKSRLKVRTVGEIRSLYEKEVNTYLTKDLEKQHNVLLRKITAGSARNENTKTWAKNMLNCDKPLSRSAWQMLMNLNPEGQPNNVQYVLYDGKKIRVNGSKGGKNKFLCNYDISKRKVEPKKRAKNSLHCSKQKSLLRNSLTVKFKPGPLSKKKCLDDSFQKFNVGDVEIINLPKPGLEIQPTYGVTMEPRISNFLQSLRDEQGTISEKWAELATAVVGSISNHRLVQNDQSSVKFDLLYKYDQNRLLMRSDGNKERHDRLHKQNDVHHYPSQTTEISCEIRTVIDKLLDSVEISLEQDNYAIDDEPRPILEDPINTLKKDVLSTKDKSNKRMSELDRLDVTVIRLPEASQDEKINNKCSNAFCNLGCICASLSVTYNLKDHCGRVDCMFQCRCDFSKYKTPENNCPGLISGLLNLNNKINLGLSKEEQKFRQTVVLAGDKNIFLKAEKRNWKATKRYADFYSNMCLKSDLKTQPILSIADAKIDCANLEPWCLVHNLYKCFCRGKFTTTSVFSKNIEEKEVNETIPEGDTESNTDEYADKEKATKRARPEKTSNETNKCHILDSSEENESNWESNETLGSARTQPYRRRKYLSSYYAITNRKIAELEKNDQTLRQRLLSLIMEAATYNNKNKNKEDEQNEKVAKEIEEPKRKKTKVVDELKSKTYDLYIRNRALDKNSKLDSNTAQQTKDIGDVDKKNENMEFSTELFRPFKESKSKLIAWLEQSYKDHKDRLDRGFVKNTLEAPKPGKVVIYPWSFILSRYKERKNLFLVSKQPPFRIFMAIDINNPFFRNCINIDQIGMSNINEFPTTIRNLLTNANKEKDEFSILCGMSHCWELIGSVAKIRDPRECAASTAEEAQVLSAKETSNTESNISESETSRDSTTTVLEDHLDSSSKSGDNCDAEDSKWFIMTVENDFSEIQFYKRGFFVKYGAILKIINVAKMSGKTVKLSLQKHNEDKDGLQFGIYAVPDTTANCVFVGPYNIGDSLGIDMVKPKNIDTTNQTRGVWINTKTIDNVKLIENPSAFMPLNDSHNNDNVVIVSLSRREMISDTHDATTDPSCKTTGADQENPVTEPLKTVKPIKIRKTNGFYHLSSKSLLKKIASPQLLQPKDTLTLKSFITESVLSPMKLPSVPSIVKLPILKRTSTVTSRNSDQRLLVENRKPIAEIAPQIKIVDVFSQSPVAAQSSTKLPERGMFILKPEEINKRIMENKLHCTSSQEKHSAESDPINEDIENFLATSAEYIPPNADVFEISDDDVVDGDNDEDHCKDVWIECTNIENLGLIKGKINSENKLSFEFPGFKYTDFYCEDEAFTKINQVFSRKIYVPKNVNIEWRIVESEADLKTTHLLKTEDLGIDFVLTKRGLRHKRDLMANSNKSKINATKTPSSPTTSELSHTSVKNDNSVSSEEVVVAEACEELSTIEEHSKTLEEEGDNLMKEIVKTKEFLRSMTNVSELAQDRREKMVETLQNILSTDMKEEH